MIEPATLRTALLEAGYPRRAVIIEDGGEQPPALEGALSLRSDSGWVISVEDYGMREQLARFATFDEAAEAALQYLGGASDEERLGESKLATQIRDGASFFDEARRIYHAQAGSFRTELPPGVLVDRLGAPDGLLLYGPDSTFAMRSLPLSAMDETRADFGRYYYRLLAPVQVIASMIPPAGGQPGGAMAFRLLAGVTIRRLLAAGALRRVVVDDAS